MVLIASCSNEKLEKNIVPLNFTTYEVSVRYHVDEFSFYFDSSGVFLLADMRDTLHYGILPDSIIEIVNNSALDLFTDTFPVPRAQQCSHCESISIIVTAGKDTVRFVENGVHLNYRLKSIVETISNLLHSRIGSRKFVQYPFLLFETWSSTAPMPPSISPGRKNTPHK
jgi:hypothetical protein